MTTNRQGPKAKAAPGEDDLVAGIRRALAVAGRGGRSGLRVAMGDDAAIMRPRTGYETILTCDWFLEGTHFLSARHPADSVGWKCLARAVSDLAAMGALPRCFLLSLALPGEARGRWLREFLGGLRRASRSLDCPAAGGDTTRREQILINTAVVGECRRGRAVLRDGAKPGDAIFVSGRLGEAELGLRLLLGGRRVRKGDARLQKHLYPWPRLRIAAWLARERLATAMMDLSDGLSSDLPRLCAASGIGARIESRSIPAARLGGLDRRRFNALELALHGGDDYELLFTVAPEDISRIPRSLAGTSLTLIGRAVQGAGVRLLTASREEILLVRKGWDPFHK